MLAFYEVSAGSQRGGDGSQRTLAKMAYAAAQLPGTRHSRVLAECFGRPKSAARTRTKPLSR